MTNKEILLTPCKPIINPNQLQKRNCNLNQLQTNVTQHLGVVQTTYRNTWLPTEPAASLLLCQSSKDSCKLISAEDATYVYVLYTQLNTIQHLINYYLCGDNYHHMAISAVQHVISNVSIRLVSHVLSFIALPPNLVTCWLSWWVQVYVPTQPMFRSDLCSAFLQVYVPPVCSQTYSTHTTSPIEDLHIMDHYGPPNTT